MRFFLAAIAAMCFAFVVSTGTRAADKPAVGVTGILIDQACGGKMMDKADPEKAAAAHTRQCAMKEACEKSGYAVIAGNKMYKFNAKGNTLAKEYLAKSKADSDLRVHIDGEIKGDEIMVEGIVAAPAPAKS